MTGTLRVAFNPNETAVTITKAVIMFDGALAVLKMQKAFQTEFGRELLK